MAQAQTGPDAQRVFLLEVGRAFAGSLLFSFQLLMTLEMWQFGALLDRDRIAVLVAVSLPLVAAFTRYLGFKSSEDRDWLATLVDTAVTLLVGAAASAILLTIFGVLRLDDSLSVIVPTVAVLMVPASIGAAFARAQVSSESSGEELPQSYFGELLVMLMGAVVLSFAVAPTEEVLLIALLMGPWRLLALAVVSLGLLHAIVFAVDFGGQHQARRGAWETTLKFTFVGYVIALAASAFLLWVFGRFDGVGLSVVLGQVIVLGFPAALGAAAARVVL